jgi:hypothetical protein
MIYPREDTPKDADRIEEDEPILASLELCSAPLPHCLIAGDRR